MPFVLMKRSYLLTGSRNHLLTGPGIEPKHGDCISSSSVNLNKKEINQIKSRLICLMLKDCYDSLCCTWFLTLRQQIKDTGVHLKREILNTLWFGTVPGSQASCIWKDCPSPPSPSSRKIVLTEGYTNHYQCHNHYLAPSLSPVGPFLQWPLNISDCTALSLLASYS